MDAQSLFHMILYICTVRLFKGVYVWFSSCFTFLQRTFDLCSHTDTSNYGLDLTRPYHQTRRDGLDSDLQPQEVSSDRTSLVCLIDNLHNIF